MEPDTTDEEIPEETEGNLPVDDETFSDGESGELPEEETAAEEDNEAGQSDTSVSENTVMENEILAAGSLKSFSIVDADGSVLDKNQTIVLKRTGTRQLSVKPNPADATIDAVTWTCDNEQISVTDGKISLKVSAVDAAEEGSDDVTPEEDIAGIITATVDVSGRPLSQTCKVVFMAEEKALEIAIVNQDGTDITKNEVTMKSGAYMKLSAKVTPEESGADARVIWDVDDPSANIDKSTGVLTATNTSDANITVIVTAQITVADMVLKRSGKIIVTPAESVPDVKGTFGDISFSCSGAEPLKTAAEANTYTCDIEKQGSYQFTLTYQGEDNSITDFYYANNAAGIQITEKGGRKMVRNASRGRMGRGCRFKPDQPLQIVLCSGSTREPCSDIYTIRFTVYNTEFRLASRSIRTVPGGDAQELQVRTLPDGFAVKDITWTSDNPKIVSIGEKTERGVMLQFGQTLGRTQVTAKAKNFRGEDCYAVCDVIVSMKLPSPVIDSNEGGFYDYQDEETELWKIDKGGKVTLSMRSGLKSQIYYTTNGSDPATSGKLYTSPITVNDTTTIRAYAKQEGYEDSYETKAKFTIGNPKLTIPATVSLPVTKDTEHPSTKTISVTLPTGAGADDISWDSSDADIATAQTEAIEKNDEVTGYTHSISAGTTAGTCTITASIKDYAGRTQTAVCRVNVTSSQLSITPEITLVEGETSEKKIEIKKAPGNKSDVTWGKSSSLLTIIPDEKNNVQIKAALLTDTSKPLVTTVTASAESGDDTISAGCQVTVNPKQYTVRFLGWNDKPAKEELVYRNQNATPPDVEAMTTAAPKGYTFKGWKESESTWKNVNADVEIHAEYTLETYTITYDTAGKGTNPSGNPTTYQVTSKNLALHDAVPSDSAAYKFAGWYVNERYEGSPVCEIASGNAGNIVLYAKWTSARTDRLRIETIADQPYTGKAIKPAVAVYNGDTLLTQGTDYTISYKNNTKACTKPWADEKKAPAVTVKGKGNYSGSDMETFQIVPQSIASEAATVTIPDLYLAYTGKKLSVVPTVTWNGKKLKNNTDFAVTKIMKGSTPITECTEEGVYTVTVSGKGNFSGTRDIALTVTTKALLSKVKFGKLQNFVWNGSPIGADKVDAQLTYKGNTLKKGTDYNVSYDQTATEIGTYNAVFTAIGDTYAGTVTKTFQITGKPISAKNLEIKGLENLTYNGTAQAPALTISYKDGSSRIPMTFDTDYTLTYENTTNAGNKAVVVITGKNGYSGTVKKTFKIAPYSMKDDAKAEVKKITASLTGDSVPFEKGGAKPKVTVTFGETVLTEGTDYTVTYQNNKKAQDVKKVPSYTVKGKGNFKDAMEPKNFSIVRQDISTLSIKVEDVTAATPNQKKGETIGKTGRGKYKSTPKITDWNGKLLSAGTDFLKTYTFTDENGNVLDPKGQVEAGSILTVTVEGANNYVGEIKASYRVLAAKRSVAKASVSLKKGFTKEYSLEPVTLTKDDLVVKLNGEELSGEHYTIVSYMNNRAKGTAKVTIQGVGEYGGTKTINFKISPRKITWFRTP